MVERNAGVAGPTERRSLRAERAGLLHEVDLRAGHGGGGDERAVLGADEGQIALRDVGAVFGGFELALESSYPGHALLGHALLLAREKRACHQPIPILIPGYNRTFMRSSPKCVPP